MSPVTKKAGTDVTSDEEEKIEDIELEARFVASKIRKLIDSKFQIFDNKKQEFRNIEQRDVVILLRSTKRKATVFEKELTNMGIDVYTDVQENYLDSYEVKIIMDLLKIIDNPYQDLPLIHIMLSPIGMFTNDDLLEIRLTDKNDDFYTTLLKSRLVVEPDLKSKIESFIEKLEKWRELNNILNLDELIWTIYEDTGFLNYVSLMPNGELRCANLKNLFERAKEYETASFKGLFNFINFIEKVKSGSSDLGSAKLISETENVVRIMSIHKSKGLEFPIVFLASTGTSFNLMDLNKDILLHQSYGIGAKYIDYEKQIKYDTLSKKALREKIFEENISEEMRVLYVALTRAKEKLYISAIIKDCEKYKQNMLDYINIYKKENGKINPILIKKFKRFIDWIMLAYFYNKNEAENFLKVQYYDKLEILKNTKTQEIEQIDILNYLEENSKNINQEDIIKLKNELEFEYKFKELMYIPTKDSVTNIIHKNFSKENYTLQGDGNILEEEIMIELPKPKFLSKVEEEKISASRRGTIVHLCMKNLDFNKNYNLQDVNLLIEDLKNRQIITQKEAESINPYIILKFTKTKIFEELKSAKEFYKEAPFYINVPAKDVMETKLSENILVQGVIDLYYITKDDKLVLLDYKTDFANKGDEAILINRHKAQLMLYKEALEKALNKKVDKIYIYSTGLGKEIEI